MFVQTSMHVARMLTSQAQAARQLYEPVSVDGSRKAVRGAGTSPPHAWVPAMRHMHGTCSSTATEDTQVAQQML